MDHHLSCLTFRRHLLLDGPVDHQVKTHIQTHQSLVEKLGYRSQLEGHNGCVNCLQWNSDGTLLASGSDDTNIHIWNVLEGKSLACMQTGHLGNIFSVKFVPFSGDNLVLSGAEDHDVRLHDLNNFATIQTWSCCSGRVKRLAVSSQSPYLCWSASEDGCIRQYDTRENHNCSSTSGRCRNVLIDLRQTCGAVLGYTQCKCLDVNSVRTEQLAVGGFDPYIRLYDMRLLSTSYPCTDLSPRADPSCLAHFGPGHVRQDKSRHHSHSNIAITYLTFSPCGQELLANLSADQVYLFNTVTMDPLFQYCIEEGNEPSLIQLPPFCPPLTLQSDGQLCQTSEVNIPLSAQKLRDKGNQYYQQKQYTEAIHCYSSGLSKCPTWHILYSNRATALVSRNWPGDIYEALRDTERALFFCPTQQKSIKRRIKCLKLLRLIKEAQSFLDHYQLQHPEEEEFIKTMSKGLSSEQARNGYSNNSRQELSHWEANRQATACDYRQRYTGHCNTHTDIKEATFLGERGEYIGAGSDDGNVFIWEKKTANLVRILHADDSIVNCVQWHPHAAMLATSGIESVIRLWEPKPHDHESVRIESNIIQVCKKNQARIKVDPFELMLMSLRMIEDQSGQLNMQEENLVVHTQEEFFIPNSQQCHPS